MASNVSHSCPAIVCETVHYFVLSGQKVTAWKAVAVVNIIIALYGTLVNGLVIMVYYFNPRLRTIQNTIFLLLAITDISVTAFTEPIYALLILNILNGQDVNCFIIDANNILTILFIQLSLVTIVILSLQSYITLAYPYRWQSLVTKSRVSFTVVISWTVISISALCGIVHEVFREYIPAGVISLAIFIVAYTWCWTYKLVARHQREIHSLQTPSTNQFTSRTKILRSTVTALVVILALVGCYLMILCFIIFENFLGPSTIGCDTYELVWSVAVALMYLNSSINPCLVFWRCNLFKQTVRTAFLKRIGKTF